MGYRIGVRGCQHLGYAAQRMAKHTETGWNQRVIDGYVGHELTMQDMLDAGVHGVVDGGDLFHWAHPRARDIEWALRVDDMRFEAGAWLLVNTGNHDASTGSDVSATSVMHRPALHSHAVHPDPVRAESDQPRRVGEQPGFYEIHQPQPDLPLYLHLVPHQGLDPELGDYGISIDPQPVPDAVNILFSHGIFMADDRLFKAADRHGAERVIPTEWANRGWDAVVLSDYHTQGPIPGFGEADGRGRGQVWYTGSALCRGFSDEIGPRGWLLVELDDAGTVTVTPRHVWQRPQRDLPPIDATDMDVGELDELVQQRLGEHTWWDAESAELTGHGGWIVRQRITGASRQQRQSLDAVRPQWDRLLDDAASWTVLVEKLQETVLDVQGREQRRITTRVTDFSAALTTRTEQGELQQTMSELGGEAAERSLKEALTILDSTDAPPNSSPE